jgi:hypothetical protein
LIHGLYDLSIHHLIGVGMLLRHQAVLAPGIFLVFRETVPVVEGRGNLLADDYRREQDYAFKHQRCCPTAASHEDSFDGRAKVIPPYGSSAHL